MIYLAIVAFIVLFAAFAVIPTLVRRRHEQREAQAAPSTTGSPAPWHD